jgi:signal transduction histidine kinase/ActR/RegA family two-component response regulator
VGAATLAFAGSGRRYGPEDTALAEQLANAAAMAVDNARLYAEAQEANRLKDEFLATVSHELRTPLNAMLGWTRMLRGGALDKERSERALQTIERNAFAQAQIVEDLLDVSRIITGKMRLDVRSVDLHEVIELAVEANRLAVDAKDITLQVEIDRMAGPISGDPARLQQVIWNLVSNAARFTSRGGRIRVSASRVASHVEIQVADDGQGISPEFLPHVFDRFRQADGRRSRSHQGLGLGLAIVRHIVELHGGTVWAESEGLGRGAVFTIRLPLAAVRTAPAARMTELELTRLDGVSVLVVDDEEDSRELLVTVLQQAGATARAVPSAADAFAAITEDRPHVLVSDIGMPGGDDGYALLRKVRALSPELGGSVPAAALTAHAGNDARDEALRAGFQTHVPKPVDPAELCAVVANLAGKVTLRR